MEAVAVELPTANFEAPSSFSSTSASSSPPPFLSKTYDMVDDPATDSIVSWSTLGNSFVVWNVPELARDVLPKYFKHNNFSSFVRQLNTYGFRKVDSDRWEFANEGFLKGQKHLLKRINRRKPTTAHSHQQEPSSIQSSASKSCVEVGKFGLEEEVDRLKRDKNVLMQELIRLRQHQQNSDKHLQSVGQRVQAMEQRQQQMMSFLAKAMHSPGFLAQLVQQQNESSQQHITGINKKRRLPKHDEDNFGGINNIGAASDGQIIKFQPLINEAAKSMLRQILKLNPSPRREQPVGDPNAFLIDGFPPPSSLDNGFSTARNSGVTLAQMATASGQQLNLPAETALPVDFSSVLASDSLISTQIPNVPIGSCELNIHNTEPATILPDFDPIPEVLQECSVAFSDLTFAGNETSNSSVMGPIAAVVDETVPIETDDLLAPHLELDGLLDSVQKLPGSNDAFWEQFFSSISSHEDTEVNSSIEEGALAIENGLKTDQPVSWDKIHHMSNLTEQMGLLSAESKII